MVVLRRMSSDQRAPRRPRHTAEMIAQRIRARRPWRRGIAAIVLVAALAAMATMSVATERAGADAQRFVLLGDVRTTDLTLGMAISEALRAELQAAPDVKVLGEGRARETLRLMRQPDTARLIGPLALDVAQRLGVALVVTGSVVPVGAGAQIVTQVIDVASGTALATIIERAAGPEDMVPAVVRMASKLRPRVSGARVPDSPPPFPAITPIPGPPISPGGISAARAWEPQKAAEGPPWKPRSAFPPLVRMNADTSTAFCGSCR